MPRPKPKKIQIDVDGVLADFAYGFTRLRNQFLPEAEPVLPQSVQQVWEECSDNAVPGNKETWGDIRDSLYFWEELPALATDEEFQRMRDLMWGNDVYFVTAREGYRAKQQTEAWLRLNGIPNATVVMTANKAAFMRIVGITHAIDDHPLFVRDMALVTGTSVYLKDMPYNQEWDALSAGVLRVPSLTAFLDIMTADGQ